MPRSSIYITGSIAAFDEPCFQNRSSKLKGSGEKLRARQLPSCRRLRTGSIAGDSREDCGLRTAPDNRINGLIQVDSQLIPISD